MAVERSPSGRDKTGRQGQRRLAGSARARWCSRDAVRPDRLLPHADNGGRAAQAGPLLDELLRDSHYRRSSLCSATFRKSASAT